jgi:hypothetical protein
MPATRSKNANTHPGLPDKPKAHRSNAEVAANKKAKQDGKALTATTKQQKLDHLAAVKAGMTKVGGSRNQDDAAGLKAPVKTVRKTKAAVKPKIAGQGKKAKGKGKAYIGIEPESQPEELVCEFYILFLQNLLTRTLVLSSCLKIARLASQIISQAQEGTTKKNLEILVSYMTWRLC